jgi:hypothetical protein
MDGRELSAAVLLVNYGIKLVFDPFQPVLNRITHFLGVGLRFKSRERRNRDSTRGTYQSNRKNGRIFNGSTLPLHNPPRWHARNNAAASLDSRQT